MTLWVPRDTCQIVAPSRIGKGKGGVVGGFSALCPMMEERKKKDARSMHPQKEKVQWGVEKWAMGEI